MKDPDRMTFIQKLRMWLGVPCWESVAQNSADINELNARVEELEATIAALLGIDGKVIDLPHEVVAEKLSLSLSARQRPKTKLIN